MGSVSDDCLRFVAAALSDLPHAPPALVRRLADQPVDISAPLLMRSPVLTGVDLVALIGRHGLPHARAIAARASLDERIARLIRSIGALDESAPDKAEETRSRLRAMMRPAGEASDRPVRLRWERAPDLYGKLRSTVLAGVPALFHTALADALAVPLPRARAIAESEDPADLLVALRSLALSEEQAFLLAHSLRPQDFCHPHATARFLEAFRIIRPDDAAEKVARWRDGATPGVPANEPAPTPLRAS